MRPTHAPFAPQAAGHYNELVKILHVYKDFDPPIRGGMERHMALMCRFQRQWAEVEALTCSRSWRTRVVDRDGTRVTEAGEWGRFQSAPAAPLFPYYLAKMQADVTVVHVPNPTAELSVLLTRRQGALGTRRQGALVVRYQSDIVRQAAAMKLYRPFLMQFLRKADIILANSPQYLETSDVLCELRDRCRVVPLGILPEAFQAPDSATVDAVRARYGGGYVLFSGVHRYYKGIEVLVKAAKAINAPVVIAGEGPERARCQALARELNVEVAFPGSLSQEDLVAHLHGCDVFAYPSVARSESFGIGMLEAQACGKPVVSTRLGTGVEFVNLDGQTGITVPPGDANALAEAVNTLLADPAQASALGAFAMQRVAREFNAEAVARQEFELYQELL